jgi:hypothetical protein
MAASPEVENMEGDNAVWEQLTPGDIQNAKNELAARRAEMLARHAEELQAFDVDQSQLDTLGRGDRAVRPQVQAAVATRRGKRGRS